MAKAKGAKAKSVQHRHIHARLSYLHQVASYLLASHQGLAHETLRGNGDDTAGDPKAARTTLKMATNYGQPRQLLSQLRAVSLKSQIRLTPQIKHSLCKRCNSLLVAGKTSRERIVNASKGGKKPQADMLVVECDSCGTVKRFPVGQPRNSKTTGTSHGKDGQANIAME